MFTSQSLNLKSSRLGIGILFIFDGTSRITTTTTTTTTPPPPRHHHHHHHYHHIPQHDHSRTSTQTNVLILLLYNGILPVVPDASTCPAVRVAFSFSAAAPAATPSSARPPTCLESHALGCWRVLTQKLTHEYFYGHMVTPSLQGGDLDQLTHEETDAPTT